MALVKSCIVFSLSPFSIPSLTQCCIWPSNIIWPILCNADFDAFTCIKTSSQGISSSIILSIAFNCPITFFNLLWRLSESIHFFNINPPYTYRGIGITYHIKFGTVYKTYSYRAFLFSLNFFLFLLITFNTSIILLVV